MSIFRVGDGQLLHMGKRPKAGAEVVERDCTAECHYAAGERFALRHVSHESRLGDLEHEVRGVGPGVFDLGLDEFQQVAGIHRFGREVRSDMVSLCGASNGLPDDPTRRSLDEPVLLGNVQERNREG